MFDLSWTEILVIGTAAIIFIGPKELPGALRALGQWTGKAREMAREFRGSVDDMIRESEIHELKNQVEKIGMGGDEVQRSIEKAVDPEGEISAAFNPPSFPSETSPGAPPPAAPASAPDAPASPAPEEPRKPAA
jgi:sec-independent protein translocase protein TatB